MRKPKCIICGKDATRGQLLYLKPDGSEVWLCHKVKCHDKYND